MPHEESSQSAPRPSDDAWQVEGVQTLIRDWNPLEFGSYWQPEAYEGSWRSLTNEGMLWDWPDIDENSVIFEVGGYGGAFAEQIISRYQPYIYFFEPSPRAFEFSKKKFKDYSKMKMYNFGLGNKNGTFAFGNDGQLGGSFLTKVEPVIQAEMVDIAEFITKHDIQHIDMMRVNIEGGEYYLIPYIINTGIIKITRKLIIDWHSHSNFDPYLGIICAKLYETHHMIRQWTFDAWERKPNG